MKSFATLPPAERALIINEAAARLGLVPLIVEKDFWVCWTLGRIFEVEAVATHVVFKAAVQPVMKGVARSVSCPSPSVSVFVDLSA